MIEHYDSADLSPRVSLRNRLKKYEKLYKISSSLFQKYSSLTGTLHVLPDFYLIGAARSGTTSLYYSLIQHPSVYQTTGKEIHYFEKYYHLGLNWYRSFFPYRSNKFYVEKIQKKNFLTGDATPRYIDNPHIPKRVKQITPNSKFIVLLRNPIERAFSHYNMNIKNGYETLSFEKAIEHENDRIKNGYEKMLKNGSYSGDYFTYAYLERGKYAEKLKKWFEVFPKKFFIIKNSDDFFKKPETTYDEVLKFLQLSKWKLKKHLPQMVGKYQQNEIEPKVKKQLMEYFKPFNEKLYKLLEINYHWDE